MARVGVLALQGGFAAHARACEALGHTVIEVRTPRDLEAHGRVEGLVLPGGESGTQLSLLEESGLVAPLARLVEAGAPVLATCAGAILAAREVRSPAQWSFGLLDIVVTRNAYGRQLESFEATSDDGALPLLFIRAPRIVETGSGVAVLATLRGEPVLVRQRNVTAATFHPELTTDLSVHAEVFGRAYPRAAAQTTLRTWPARTSSSSMTSPRS